MSRLGDDGLGSPARDLEPHFSSRDKENLFLIRVCSARWRISMERPTPVAFASQRAGSLELARGLCASSVSNRAHTGQDQIGLYL